MIAAYSYRHHFIYDVSHIRKLVRADDFDH